MNKMKYVMFKTGEFVIFPASIAHSSFQYHGDVKSAGFIDFHVGPTGNVNINCYGRSTSLGVESDPEDWMKILPLMRDY